MVRLHQGRIQTFRLGDEVPKAPRRVGFGEGVFPSPVYNIEEAKKEKSTFKWWIVTKYLLLTDVFNVSIL